MDILIVEDNPLDAEAVVGELALSMPQSKVDLVGSYAQAAAKLSLCTPEQPVYDLILTDIRLPDGNGLSLLPLIRERRLDMAVVVLFGAGQEESVVAALKAGATDYVIKHVGYLDHLPAALESAWQLHRAEAERQARPLQVLYAEHRTVDVEATRKHFALFAPTIRLDVLYAFGEELLQRLTAQGECDVLVLDYHLPGANGLKLLKDWQRSARCEVPVVLLVDPGDEEAAAQALRLGALAFVVRHPGYLFQLHAAVENAFARAKMARELAASQASEAYHRSRADSTFEVRMALRADGTVYSASGSLERALGYKPEELAGADGLSLFHPEDAPRLRQAVDQALVNHEVTIPLGAIRQRHCDGTWRRMDAAVWGGERDDTGKDLVVISAHDVTEHDLREEARQHAAAALQRDKAYFEKLVATTPAIVVGVGADGRLRVFNQAAEQTTGFSRAELEHGDWLETIMPRDGYPEAWAEFERLKAGGLPRTFESNILTKAGEERYIAWQSTELRDAGQAIGTLFFGFDLTEHKRVEAALANTEKRFRALIEHSDGAIALLNLEGKFLYLSPAAGHILGLPVEEWVGRKLVDLVHPDDLPLYQAAWGEMAQKPWADSHRQCRLRRHDGSWRWVDLTATNWLADASLRAVVVTYRDITEAFEREHELTALVTLSRALRTARNRAEMLPIILDQVLGLLTAEASALVVRDPATGGLRMELGAGRATRLSGQLLTSAERTSEAIITSGQPYLAGGRPDEQTVALLGLTDESISVLAGIPLLAQNRVLGVLWMGRKQALSDGDMRLFTGIGNLAANALHRATLHEQMEQYARQMKMASQAGRALAETNELSKIYACLGEAVRDLLPDISGLFISLFDTERNLVSCAYAYSDGKSLDPTLFPPISLGLSGQGPQGEAIYSRRPVIVNHPRERRRSTAILTADPRTSEVSAPSGLYVPMLVQTEVVGVVQVQSRAPNRFGQGEAEVLMLLGNTAAVAIENARLLQRQRSQVVDLSIVAQMAQISATHATFDQVVAWATEALKPLWPETSSLGFMFVNAARTELQLHASYQGAPLETTAPFALNEGLMAEAVREMKPVRVGKVLADPRYRPLTMSTRSQMVAPLVVGESAIGLVNIESSRVDAFSEGDLLRLTALAGKLAPLMDKARLDDEAAARLAELEAQAQELAAQLETANTERQQAALNVKRAGRTQAEVVARTSRAMRALSGVVLGRARDLEKSAPGAASGDTLRQVLDAGQQSLTLIDQLLEIAQLESGQLAVMDEPIEVETLVQDILGLLQPLAASCQIGLNVDLPGRWSVRADRPRLKQVLQMLLSIIVEYNQVGGAVTVELKRVDAWPGGGEVPAGTAAAAGSAAEKGSSSLHFSVRNAGPGRLAGFSAWLSEGFPWLETDQLELAPTGLGLSLAKHLVDAMHGNLGMESQSEQGDTFWIELPLAEAPAPQPPESSKGTRPLHLRLDKTTILRADDASDGLPFTENIRLSPN